MSFLLLLSVFSVLAVPSVYAAVNTSSRVVSIVYDDSGSMKDKNKFVYANYAVQMFMGLLGDRDRLFLTYMSGDTNEIDLSSRQKTIDVFRKKTSDDGTYFTAVENAFNKLKETKAEPESEYWLVIITDGRFPECSSEKALKKRLNKLYDTDMKNGTKAKIEYMAIEGKPGDTIVLSDDPAHNIKASSTKGDKIVNEFSKIANEITGKTKLDSADISFPSDKEISVKSELPLKNIVSIIQGKTAGLLSVSDSEGNSYDISRNINIEAPETAAADGKNKGKDELTGIVGVCEKKGKALPAGTYTLKFNHAVSSSTVDILFEPALDVKTVVYGDPDGDGKKQELKPPFEIYKDMELEIKTEICDPITGKPIDGSILKKYGVKTEVEYFEDGQKVDTFTGDDITFKVGEGDNGKISSVISIGDFEPVSQETDFSILSIPVYEVTFESGSNYTYVIPYTIFRSKNKEINNTGSLVYSVTKDGVSLKKEDIKSVGYKIGGIEKSNYDGKLSDGKITVTPKDYTAWDYFWDGGIFKGITSEKTVEVTVKDSTAEGSFTVDATNVIWELLFLLLMFILFVTLVVYIIVWFITAGRFPPMTVEMITWAVIDRSQPGDSKPTYRIIEVQPMSRTPVGVSRLEGSLSSKTRIGFLKHACERKATKNGLKLTTRYVKGRFAVSVTFESDKIFDRNYQTNNVVEARNALRDIVRTINDGKRKKESDGENKGLTWPVSYNRSLWVVDNPDDIHTITSYKFIRR